MQAVVAIPNVDAVVIPMHSYLNIQNPGKYLCSKYSKGWDLILFVEFVVQLQMISVVARFVLAAVCFMSGTGQHSLKWSVTLTYPDASFFFHFFHKMYFLMVVLMTFNVRFGFNFDLFS